MGDRRIEAADEGDARYWEQRAEAELELAQRATNPAVVKAHYDLANRYLERLYPAQDNEPPLFPAA